MRSERLPLVLAGLVVPVANAGAEERWSAAKAWDWYEQQPWLVGFNYVTSTAVNDVDMWQADGFDPETIDRELGWAEATGFNTYRVFLNYVAWEADPEGFCERLDAFMSIAEEHGISVMPMPFDDCAFSGKEPVAGPQPDPVPGIHNSQWVASPGAARVRDRDAWPQLERYVKDVVGRFAEDERVVLWDLYNEPGNSDMGDDSLPLVEAAFAWAREAGATQPLTVGVWAELEKLNEAQIEMSDVVSFHIYGDVAGLESGIRRLREHGRPIICTEWMARTLGGSYQTQLPVFERKRVGCYCWGLVAGKTQTHYPWGSEEGADEPVLWFHDLFHADGKPWDPGEVLSIGDITRKVVLYEIVPTSRDTVVPWRYTFDQPGERWFRPDYEDDDWSVGAAPFGKEEPKFSRRPRTEWTSDDIWLRREFAINGRPTGELYLWIYHDDDADVYINGVLACEVKGYKTEYAAVPLPISVRTALRRSGNVIAIHCRQDSGGQYIDAGIVEARKP